MLTRLVQNTFCNDAGTQSEIFFASLCYCVRHIEAHKFQKKLFELSGNRTLGKNFRLELCENAYFLCNLKLFLLNYRELQLYKKSNVKLLVQTLKKFHIDTDDFKNILRIGNTKLLNVLKLVYTDFCDCTQTIDTVNKGFNSMYQPLLKYVKFLTRRKLSFILTSNNICYDDMCCELMQKALRAHYVISPSTKTELHVLNYLKRVVHNHAMNIIKKYTFVKRSRLINNGVGFTLMVASENQHSNLSDGSSYSIDSETGDNCEYTQFENRQTFHVINLKLNAFKQRFLNISLGNYDFGFTQYLVEAGKCAPGVDNTDFYHKNTTTYQKYVCKFLNVDPEGGKRLLQKIYCKNFGR